MLVLFVRFDRRPCLQTSPGMSVFCPSVTCCYNAETHLLRVPGCNTEWGNSSGRLTQFLQLPKTCSWYKIYTRGRSLSNSKQRICWNGYKEERNTIFPGLSRSQRQHRVFRNGRRTSKLSGMQREVFLVATSSAFPSSVHSIRSQFSHSCEEACPDLASGEYRERDVEVSSSSSSTVSDVQSVSQGNHAEKSVGSLLLNPKPTAGDEVDDLLHDRSIFKDNCVQFARTLGRVISVAMVFAALGFGPTRRLSGNAMAVPTETSSSTDRHASEKSVPRTKVEGERGQGEDAGEEVDKVETEEEERERLEREREFRAALQVDQKLKDLEAFQQRLGQGPEQKIVFRAKLEETKRLISVERRRLQGLQLMEMQASITEMKKEQTVIGKRAQKVADEHFTATRDLQRLAETEGNGGGPDRKARERAVEDAEGRLQALSQSILDLEGDMLEKKLLVERAVLEELPAIEDKSKAEFDNVWEQWMQKQSHRHLSEQEHHESEDSKVTRDLEQMAGKVREETLLPLAVGIKKPEVPKIEVDAETRELIDKIKAEQEKAQELRAIFEKLVKQKLGKTDNESLDHIPTPEGDVAMGLPPPELNLRSDEGVPKVPVMAGLEGALGWKKWREEAKNEFKQYLLDNPEAGQQYIAERQEQILVARDRVMAQTWYNEKQKRWEMAPMAASYSVTKQLVDKARIRHDRRVMYLTLKGDDREYFVDIEAIEVVLEEAGGFDTLYIKMTTSGIPTTTEFMWIPFREWPVWELFKLPFNVVWWVLEDIWDSPLLLSVRPWYFKTLSESFEEVMIRFGFPFVHRIVPHWARVALSFDLPEGAEVAEPTDLMLWQQEAQKKVDGRYGEGTGSPAWWISLPIRCYVVGMPLLFVVKHVGRIALAPFEPRRLAPNDVEWKEKKQAQLEKELEPRTKKESVDPIRSVFDKMKRVKRPQVGLQDFAGIDSVKEEISEVVSFLRNPKRFKEMGARPPRGVLIVGESGTGKTTLALAIAAEARVPMIELQGAELEGGSWVGQGASNVRELFKTARELAPLIIFMDDFDHFAGVRGATSDTRKQDHESLINQLLVELDGFETQEGVVLIATTSRPWAIDEALRRPGRMDRTIQLPMPNQREREQILLKAAHDTMDVHMVNAVNWTEVAKKTAGLTPSRLKYVPEGLEGIAVGYKIVDDEELSCIAGWLATLNTLTPTWIKNRKFYRGWNESLVDWLGLRVTKDDMDAAVEDMDVFGETKPGMELRDPHVVWTREYKFPHAVWAAGRGLIALLLPNFDSVDQIWLDQSSWEGIAFTRLTKRLEGGSEETGTMTRSYYEKSLVLCFGPYVAARLLLPFGENNNLCRFDLENAQEIAARMVLELGWGPEGSPHIYMTGGSSNGLAIGDNHEYELEAQIEKLFHTACDRAVQMIQHNRPVLDALLEHLLQFDSLTKKDMARILEETGAVFEEEPFMLIKDTREIPMLVSSVKSSVSN